ncbi:MAG: TIGR04372 family glycosyltransferase [Actinomycetota bacterium]|nr:TIGR04372 family glycosyltransferase [Actinomycetota bacterium]
MKIVRVFLKIGLRILVLPVVLFLYFSKKFFVVEFVLPNVTLFGHLALEPEKILSKIKAENGQFKRKPKRILIWSFSKSRYQVNKALVRIWRRELTSLPPIIVDATYRASKWLPNFEIKILQFDKLHENDHVIDACDSHLKFSKSEVQLGEDYLRSVGVKPGESYICLVVRETAWAPPKTGPTSSGTLRSRSFEDFLPAAQALAELDVTVIKLGAAGTFQTAGTKIVDYANSDVKSELLDVYLPAHAKCVISTMSGPDAVALVGRVPVLYVDIAQYSLCFAGTSLVTWVPALLYSQKLGRVMTMSEVFDSGAGRFLGSTAFEQAGIRVMQSSPEKISEYCIAFYKNLALPSYGTDELQRQYRNKFHTLLSRNSVAKLGPLNSSLSEVFLKENGEAFLA